MAGLSDIFGFMRPDVMPENRKMAGGSEADRKKKKKDNVYDKRQKWKSREADDAGDTEYANDRDDDVRLKMLGTGMANQAGKDLKGRRRLLDRAMRDSGI